MAISVGWDGPGQNAATLNYFISGTPSGLSQQQVETTIGAALKVWSTVANIQFVKTSRAGMANSLDITFGRIDGAGRVLAQAYFPKDVNPSRIAGDVKFDSSERWEIGNSQGGRAFDLMQVAVHEIGHALGLDHNQSSGSVMRSTVSANQKFSSLASVDKTAILQLYAPAKGTARPASTFQATVGTPIRSQGSWRYESLFASNENETPSDDSTPIACNRETGPNESRSGMAAFVSSIFDRLDTNADGSIAAEEVPEAAWNWLGRLDLNQDELVSKDEVNLKALGLSPFLFHRLDADNNGMLGASELDAAVWESLTTLDTDADGALTMEEVAADKAIWVDALFKQFDSDGDGELASEELGSPVREWLSQADTDGNSTINSSEWSIALLQQRSKHQGRHWRLSGHGRS